MECNGIRSSAIRLKTEFPWTADRSHLCIQRGWNCTRSFRRWFAEDYEYCSPGLKLKRNCRASVCHLVGSFFGCSGFGIPQLRLLAGNAERGIDRFRVVAAIINEIDVGVREFAVNEFDVGVIAVDRKS